MPAQGVTEMLCRFATELRYKGIPKEAIGEAKRSILDTVAVAVAGSQEPGGAGRIAIELVREMGGVPTCSVIGGGFKTCSVNAAFANGTSGHTLDFDDTTIPINHYNSALVPAILTLAEETRVSGKKTLEAYVAAYEVGARIGQGLKGTMPGYFFMGFHPVGTWPTLGISVGCSKLLDANVTQMKVAMGIASSAACGLRRDFGTNTKPLHAGYAARNGLVAAKLGKKGFTAHTDILDDDPDASPGSSMYFSFPRVFSCGDNYDLAAMVEGLGETLHLVSGVNWKKFRTGSVAGQIPVDIVLEAMQKHGFTAKQVEHVECSTPRQVVDVAVFHDPQTGDQARYSIEYQVAAALLDGRMGIEQHREERVRRADVREMMKKVHVYERKDISPASYEKDSMMVKMIFKLKDGREYTEQGGRPIKGTPSLPLTNEDLANKYRDCVQRAIPDAQVEKSLKLIENFEELKDVGELMEILKGKA